MAYHHYGNVLEWLCAFRAAQNSGHQTRSHDLCDRDIQRVGWEDMTTGHVHTVEFADLKELIRQRKGDEMADKVTVESTRSGRYEAFSTPPPVLISRPSLLLGDE